MKRQWLACAGVSLLLIAPVLVQEHVQAGDLASHLYNTWLVLLVRAGEPLGLELAPQFSNVLFDWWLEGLWRIGGPGFAEKAAVSISVLLFFWGAFFLVGRLTERSAWPSSPLLAMLAYGWVYHQGFFNYYLACAFGFWAIGLAVSGGAAALAAAAALLAAAAVGHLMGAVLAAAFAAFLLARRKLPLESGKWLLLGGFLGVAAVGAGLPVLLPAVRMTARWLHVSGVTPFLVYGPRYFAPAVLLALFWITAALWTAARFRRRAFDPPAASLALLTMAGLVFLPTSLVWPGTRHSLFFIDWRLALWFTLFLHMWLIARLPSRFTLGACSAAAAIYFVFLASDWHALGRTERAFHEAVRQLPPGSRAITDVTTIPSGMNPMLHMIDRACIGHCFSYGNYEPASAAFRLRVQPGSPVVLDSPRDVFALMEGRYIVRPGDLPLYGVLIRQAATFALEVRPLQAGEKVHRTIVPLPRGWL